MLTAQAIKNTKSLVNENLQGFFVNFFTQTFAFQILTDKSKKNV
jgi:hypothetical protein